MKLSNIKLAGAGSSRDVTCGSNKTNPRMCINTSEVGKIVYTISCSPPHI